MSVPPTFRLRGSRCATLAALALGAACEGGVAPEAAPAPTASVVAAAPAAASSGEVEAVRMIAARGPERLLRVRPAPSPQRACSRRRAICVHAKGAPSGRAAHLLASAERALDGLAALRLPGPLPDYDRGGGPELDLYLVPDLDVPTAVADLSLDHATWDAAPAFVLAPLADVPGCVADADLARAIARAALIGRDAGVEESFASVTASYLATLVAPCGIAQTAAIDAFQRTPERGLDREATDDDVGTGGQLFLDFLEARFGSGRPGELAVSLVGAAPQRTPPGAPSFQNEPDVVDVLVGNAKAGGSPPFSELLLDFAVERAFIGSRSDDRHLLDVARYGDAGRVRFDWSVTYASLPRTLSPARPLLPTGASYVWIDLADAAGGSALTLVARWEPPVAFRWAVVKVGADGEERGRLEPPTQLGATELQQSLVDLHDLAGLVVIAVNAGGSSALDTYDPDDGPHAGQAYTLALYPE